MRMSSFSLKSRANGPLDFDGARRENILRGAGYAWTLVLVSFFKLQEVGFSPYLSFYSHLNVLLMFRLNENGNGKEFLTRNAAEAKKKPKFDIFDQISSPFHPRTIYILVF